MDVVVVGAWVADVGVVVGAAACVVVVVAAVATVVVAGSASEASAVVAASLPPQAAASRAIAVAAIRVPRMRMGPPWTLVDAVMSRKGLSLTPRFAMGPGDPAPGLIGGGACSAAACGMSGAHERLTPVRIPWHPDIAWTTSRDPAR